VSGAKVYFKIKGTNTNATTYTDSALTVPASNPVVADAAGWFNTYLSPTINYDVEIKSANDAITYRSFSESPSATGSQPVDATLTALAGLGLENRKLIRGTGVDTGELVTISTATDVFNAKDYGATGDGTTDDTTALQAAVDAVAAAGGILYIPEGVYIVTARITRLSSAASFIIQGAGREATIIRRGSTFNASVMEWRESHNCSWRDFSVDGGNATYANGNHGLVIFDCDAPIVERVNVTDWKNTGILVYAPAGTRSGARIRDCKVDGLGLAPVGILISDMLDSGMSGCSAYNVTNAVEAALGYGLELKNTCDGCFITEGYVQDCTVAVAFGQDISATSVINSRVSAISKDCNYAFLSGYAENNHIDIIADMAGAAAGENIIDLQSNSIGNSVRLTARNITTLKGAARIRSGCTDNHVKVDVVGALLSTSDVAIFDSGALRNTVLLSRVGGTPFPSAGWSGLVTDNSSGGTNTIQYELYPRFELRTIASGAIALTDPSTRSVILDTEGAAASDDLDTITGPTFEGVTMTLRTTSNLRDVVVKHNTGNIVLNGSADFTLDAANDTITLRWNAGTSRWCEIGRGNNS
jgi:hypothetical protein